MMINIKKSLLVNSSKLMIRNYSTTNITGIHNVEKLVNGYRKYGYLNANVDPLGRMERVKSKYTTIEYYGFNDGHQNETFKDIQKLLKHQKSSNTTLKEISEYLDKVYCGDVSVQFDHIESAEEKEWLFDRFEEIQNQQLTKEERLEIAKNLVKSEVFDHFLQKKFPTFKRYGLEGNESMIVSCNSLFRESVNQGIENVVIGMPHRGRLNLLVQICGYPAKDLFWKIKGNPEFSDDLLAIGDVASHIGVSSDLQYPGGNVHVSLINNPSHLEAADPVAMGKVRAKQFYEGKDALCFMLHGDAAVAGQGVVTETLQLSQLTGFGVGGCVHLIANNQLGFTTIPKNGRSTRYSGDIGKFIGAPILVVNSQNPEMVEKVTRFAVEYRQKFKKDIVIDLVGWRKYGHNEVDEPSFTQPTMYSNIRKRQSIPQQYASQLANEGLFSSEQLQAFTAEEQQKLEQQLSQSLPETFKFSPMDHLEGKWKGIVQSHTIASKQPDTGYNVEELKKISVESTIVPESFQVHNRLLRSFSTARNDKVQKQQQADWATAESMAVGSLMKQGYNVRISGQDVGRGTFSQRHFNLHEQNSDSVYQPLNHMTKDSSHKGGQLEVVNSNLSEFAVLGYEYGYSIESPKTLPIWEAQFGDFVNGAQIIVDNFITSSEVKWLRQTGIVILLPHGYDGAGPEHSSCRLERFLQASDAEGVDVKNLDKIQREHNIYIINPSTPANYFHALRRQMIRNFRKPLVVAGPKVLLRHPNCFSSLQDMAPGTSFQPVLPDPDTMNNASSISHVIFCSGKVFYDLQEERSKLGLVDKYAIVRLEELSPFPYKEIANELKRYSNATKFAWVQEEQQNTGAWTFVEPRFKQAFDKTSQIKYIGRGPLAASATGYSSSHKKEAAQLLKDAFNF
ncbi:oxoglutarate dehydrogenase (succinyl-transferring) [Tieghemostelium lacteum]|uniref:Oxoglutarate dehydrogenase (Succinyl-transferring) n=1 Tax=Tieghemostelium lacteum TaxID=361077 RepID=A0A151ZCQ2_TIELA|nr:oxoglutarate dehydrogenase (succinyl-transferring) [Tieghemostelium lacteum]|eukprot:KYQ91728.1 oxoglutarate dehydrogenase (succinyl-transferring) [Tieghemostelium lacteum]